MKYYNIRIVETDRETVTELKNANLKTILNTLKSLSKNSIQKQYIKSTGKRIRIASDKFNKEVQAEIKNF